MKKYLGSKIDLFSAILTPCFIVGPVLFSVAAFRSEVSSATVLLSGLCICCSITWGYLAWNKRGYLYAWGTFGKDAVHVKVLFQNSFSLKYSECARCGIAYYRHAFLNNRDSKLGSNVYYIFLSADLFDEKYRERMNLWVPTAKHVKAAFSKKLYDHLLSSLPEKQANMLKRDHEKYME